MTDTDPHELAPESVAPESTPRVPLSPYAEMLQAAVRHQQQSEVYKRLLDRALERGDILEAQHTRTLIELGECKAMLLDATVLLRDASEHLQSSATTFLKEVQEIKANCRHCPELEPDVKKVHLSVAP